MSSSLTSRPTIEDLAERLRHERQGFTMFFDYQIKTFEDWIDWLKAGNPARWGLYYRTGAGKSITSLVMLRLKGYEEVLVIAPPITHTDWHSLANALGMRADTISHAKFRQPDYKLDRHMPLIVDEFHLLGGHQGKGWKKLDRAALLMPAPIIICSATPNYNDAERVYCIQHVLGPAVCRGGFLEFLYQNCNTRQNPFGQVPLVDEEHPFRHYEDAIEFLASLPYMSYVPSNVSVEIDDVEIPSQVPGEFYAFGLNQRTGRIMASQMEARYQEMYINLVGDDGYMQPDVEDMLTELVGMASTPVILYCNSEKVTVALSATCARNNANFEVITGKTTTKEKAERARLFREGKLDMLIGTASLATGTDGFDKVCDCMIIVNDTPDASLRQQLIGRILPRGADSDASQKQVWRLVYPHA